MTWRRLTILLALLVTGAFASAQDMVFGESQMTPPPSEESDPFAVRPLEELIADALVHAPLLKVQELNVDNVYHKIKLLEKEWSQYLNFIGSFQMGNIRFLDILDSDSGGENRTITRENTFYGLGLQLRLPLYDFVTRGDRRALLQNQLEQEKWAKQDRELQIRELVIRQYEELQLAVRILEIKAKDLDFHSLTSQMAEKHFREGAMKLSEYTEAVNERNRAEEGLVQAKSKATVAFQILRELVGKEIGIHK